MIYDGTYSLLVLIEKLAFFNKQLQGFIISLTLKELIITQKPLFKLILKLFLNFRKIQKFEKEKSVMKPLFFIFCLWLLKVQKQLMKKSEIRFGW